MSKILGCTCRLEGIKISPYKFKPFQLENERVRIVIEPGHGGEDTGIVYKDRMEKNENLKLALAVGEILSNYGVEVIYTRTTDVSQTDEEIQNIIETSEGNLYLGIHRVPNVGIPPYPGTEVIIVNTSEMEKLASRNINFELENMGYNNLGIIQVSDNLDVEQHNTIPSINLILGVFGPNHQNLDYDEKFEETAQAIAHGILKTFQLQAQNLGLDYRYRVQVGLFRDYNNALNLLNRLLYEGYQAEIVRQGDFYSIQVGNFSNLDEAADLERRLRSQGYDTLLIAV